MSKETKKPTEFSGDKPKRLLKIRIKTAKNGEKYFVILSPNGKVIADSLPETYHNMKDLHDTVNLLREGLSSAIIVGAIFDDNVPK